MSRPREIAPARRLSKVSKWRRLPPTTTTNKRTRHDLGNPHARLNCISTSYDDNESMGIGGLLPLLKSIQVQQHLSEFSGKTVAVDAYVWLHRGVFTCATELATGKPTSKYVMLFPSD